MRAISIIFILTDWLVNEWMNFNGLCLKGICILRLLFLIVEWKSLSPLKELQASASRWHSPFKIHPTRSYCSVYKQETLKQLRNSLQYRKKNVILPNNWFNDKVPAYCKFSVNYAPQVLDRFPILLGLNQNELQKVNPSSRYRDISTGNIQRNILEDSMMYRKSNELAAKRSGFSFSF